jgi:hypothetical protein
MKEKNFTSEVTRFLKHAGVWYHKIQDTPISQGYGGGLMRFALPKPFDLLFNFGDITCACELKMSKNSSIAFDSFKDHQIENLRAFQGTYRDGLFLVRFYIKKTSTKKAVNKVFQLRIDDFPDSTYFGRKSIPLEWFERHAVEIPKIHIDGKIAWGLWEVSDGT